MTSYLDLAGYCWLRAHRTENAKWRSYWFNQFEVAITFAGMEG